jgi:hypothetical protein
MFFSAVNGAIRMKDQQGKKKYEPRVAGKYPSHMGSYCTSGEMIIKDLSYQKMMNCPSEERDR